MLIFIKNIIKLLIPEILSKKGLLKFRRYLNETISKNERIDFEKNFYNRISFVQRSIARFNYETCKYLEIGTYQNETFNSIPLPKKNKFGVDPESGGNIRLTSDEFFKINKKKFNVIFIDGLHNYEQCQRDILNSLNSLQKNGIILIHDLLPKNKFYSMIPRKQDAWTGDIWKIAVELINSRNVKFVIANIDHGVGIIKPQKNYNYKKMNKLLLNENYKSFYYNFYKKLPIVNSEVALQFINN
jgi:hypothetical protein